MDKLSGLPAAATQYVRGDCRSRLWIDRRAERPRCIAKAASSLWSGHGRLRGEAGEIAGIHEVADAPVPFFFKVLKPSRFFANITHLRRTQRNRIILNLARYTGIGWAGIRIAQFRLARETAGIRSRTATASDRAR